MVVGGLGEKLPERAAPAHPDTPAAPRSASHAHRFCHGNECPEYQVLNKTASYEVREHWVCAPHLLLLLETPNLTRPPHPPCP